MTLLEILVTLAVLALISVLLYGAFDSLSRGKKGEAARTERARQGREAITRITRELQSAYISAHQPQVQAMVSRVTLMVSQQDSTFDRLDFTAMAHRRLEADAKESDQAEIGYSVVKDPDKEGKFDLVRREQTPIDIDPRKGGVVNVLIEDVEAFDLRFLDPLSGLWLEAWDSTSPSGQPDRLPLAVRVSITLKGVRGGPPLVYSTKVMLSIRDPLSFGISR